MGRPAGCGKEWVELMDFHYCHVTNEAMFHVGNVLDAGRLSEGPMVKLFEEKLSTQLGLANPVCTNSGTSALHLALLAAGVRPGDEVILPAQTFAATGMAVLYCGATPVFADVDPHTGNLCPESVQKRITRKTKVVLCVHWAGYPCDLYALHCACGMQGVLLVEDAAHALGATYQRFPVGANTQLCCFSFQAVKHLTTGDGGAVCSSGAGGVAALVRRARWFGIDRTAPEGPLGEREFGLHAPGYKYHMNDLAAAVGLGNLNGIEKRLARRRLICSTYRQEFEGVKGLTLLRQDPDRESACWVFSVLVDRRGDFVRTMKERGVPCSVVNRRIDTHHVFGPFRDDLPGQGEFDQKHIALPCHPGLTPEDVNTVVKAVQGGW